MRGRQRNKDKAEGHPDKQRRKICKKKIDYNQKKARSILGHYREV